MLPKVPGAGSSLQTGETVLNLGQVGWLDRPSGTGTSVLSRVAGESGSRLMLYAGQPRADPIVSYSPFSRRLDAGHCQILCWVWGAGKFPRRREL